MYWIGRILSGNKTMQRIVSTVSPSKSRQSRRPACSGKLLQPPKLLSAEHSMLGRERTCSIQCQKHRQKKIVLQHLPTLLQMLRTSVYMKMCLQVNALAKEIVLLVLVHSRLGFTRFALALHRKHRLNFCGKTCLLQSWELPLIHSNISE